MKLYIITRLFIDTFCTQLTTETNKIKRFSFNSEMEKLLVHVIPIRHGKMVGYGEGM